jgi:MoaA/NifB/PqqE/SkfB family radical SAM enzyme
MNVKAFLNTISDTARTLPIVILYVTEGCNLKCITCSYRQPLPNELSFGEIKDLAGQLKKFGLKHIVYSGGEPLVRSDFSQICELFFKLGVKQTLLTNGLLLGKRLNDFQNYFHEIIVSVDGAKAETHDSIRGVKSFDIIIEGIKKTINSIPPSKGARGMSQVSIRTVLQKRNFKEVLQMVDLAKSLNVNRISFLAADVLSDAFGRDTRGPAAQNESILLDAEEVQIFRNLIEEMKYRYSSNFNSGFISESHEKLLNIVRYFEAAAGMNSYPRNYCNAPNVSAVITSTGDVHPCFFLPSFGNVRADSFQKLINTPKIKQTRRDVKNYKLERCKTCVCTLNITPMSALSNSF